MNRVTSTVACVLAVLSFAGTVGASGPPIDLDIPGNLAAVERDNPTHFAKIRRILAEVQEQKTQAVPTWMRTHFEARAVSYTDLLMVSYPPKKRLAFTLDETGYVAMVTLTNFKPDLVPAK
jgi:hypothetical protein